MLGVLLIILIIWTALNLYVFWRLATIPFVVQHVPRWVLAGVAAFLWAAFPASRWLEHSGLGVIGHAMAVIGTYWLGILFLLFVPLLAVDLITVFGFAFHRAVPALRSLAILTGSALALVAIVQGARAPEVRSHEVQIANLRPEYDGTVVVVASDLHAGTLTNREWLSAVVDQINGQKPDLIILAGDVMEGNGAGARKYLPVLGRLSAPYGVWAVNGNHETYGSSPGSQLTRLEDAGFHVLHDQWAEVRPGVVIAGVNDLTTRHRHGQRPLDYVNRALAGRPASATIFVSHTPWLAERAAELGAGLMLSGHTHNGQIWPFNYLVRLTYPLISGRYDVHQMPVFVCRGTGTWGPRMRLWQRGELLRLTLRTPALKAKR